MKKIGIIILGICVLNSCGNSKNKKNVGSDKDKHGCIASAGYTWSALKLDCVRVFEIGKQLKSIDTKATSSAFLVFNDDKSKLELFLPETKKTTILSLTENGNYKADNYLLDITNMTLSINGEVKYKV